MLQGVRVTLSVHQLLLYGPSNLAVMDSSNSRGLRPNVHKLTVTASGMSIFTLSDIPLRTGEFHILLPVTLSISPVTTTVTCGWQRQAIVTEQQRIGGIIPNF